MDLYTIYHHILIHYVSLDGKLNKLNYRCINLKKN